MKTNSMFAKASKILKDDGFISLFFRLNNYLFKGFWMRAKVFHHDNAQDVFTEIYKTNYWGSEESISGTGSEISQTELISNELPKIFQKYSVKTFLDAPCGDFVWMKRAIEKCNIDYIGADIVADLVELNNKSFSSESISFVHLDICNDNLPQADLMLCRDCLFHLSFADIKSFFIKFSNSNIEYLLLTNHKQFEKKFKNLDIKTGDFRMLDLFSEPINLSPNVNYRFDDYKDPEPPREICLFSRSQIQECIAKWQY